MTVVCLGDSITKGVTRVRSSDPEGGYPGRLQRRFGDRARLVNRGVGGASTRLWLLDPTAAAHEKEWWEGFERRWNGPPPPPDRPLVAGVLDADRPDVVVVLLGVNDLYYEASTSDALGLIERIGKRLQTIVADARTTVATVLLATALPNRRDPAALIGALNAQIRALEPDYLPVGERFAALDWPRLMSDDMHPNAAGYQALADLVGDELVRRGVVAP